jgi:hypothetical protein
MKKVLSKSFIYYQSLSFILHVQNQIFDVPQLSNPVIFGPSAILDGSFRNWVYKVPQLSIMFVFVPQLSNLFIFSLTLLEVIFA